AAIGPLHPAIVPAEVDEVPGVIDLRLPGMEMWACRIMGVLDDHTRAAICLELSEVPPVRLVLRIDVARCVLQALVSRDHPLGDGFFAETNAGEFECSFFRIRTVFERISFFSPRIRAEPKGVG